MRRCLVWLPIAALLGALALECQRCHEVPGMELPQPAVQPPVPVVLGGLVANEMTDGYLTASIVNPSSKRAYQRSAQRKELVTAGVDFRMPEYADRMTVRQLTDPVAFLQSRYPVRRGSPK